MLVLIVNYYIAKIEHYMFKHCKHEEEKKKKEEKKSTLCNDKEGKPERTRGGAKGQIK